MLLKEFFEFNDTDNDFKNDRRYDNSRDTSRLTKSDTRKLRLTLRQINRLRLQSEAHEAEKQAEAGLIQMMYGNPVDAPQ